MTPVDLAFGADESQTLLDDEQPALLASALQGERAFSAKLRAIPLHADSIERDLNRSVWNGTVRQCNSTTAENSVFAKTLLWEVSRVGIRMREVFARAIGNLQSTVLSALLEDSRFFAGLAVDILDRNLYERANDCRWWALDQSIRRLLADPAAERRGERMEQTLRYINDLYTVYSNLLVFDAGGEVITVSNPAERGWVGTHLEQEWVTRTLSLRNSQQYVASAFAPSELYGQQHYFIYSGAVQAPDSTRVVGGIAIVFDSTPQLSTVLREVLPALDPVGSVGEPFAVFLDAQGRVMSVSDGRWSPGELPPLPASLCRGLSEPCFSLLALDGQVLAVGACPSTGYREFKRNDGYRNPITAVLAVPLGEHDTQRDATSEQHNYATAQRKARSSAQNSCEIATFMVGGHWLGLPVQRVIEAIEPRNIARVARAPAHIRGVAQYEEKTLARCARMARCFCCSH